MTIETIATDTYCLTPEQEQILKELDTCGVFKKVFQEVSIFWLILGISLMISLFIYMSLTVDTKNIELIIKYCIPYIVFCLYVLILRIWHNGLNPIDYLRNDVLSLTTNNKLPILAKSKYLNFNGIFLFHSMSLLLTFLAYGAYNLISKELYVGDISLTIYVLILISIIWIPLNVYIGVKNLYNRTTYIQSFYRLTGYNLYSDNYSDSNKLTTIVKTTLDRDVLFEEDSIDSQVSQIQILVCINIILCMYSIFIVTQYEHLRIQPTTSLITVLESYISKEDTLIKDLNNKTRLKTEYKNCTGRRCIEIEQELGSGIDKPVAELSSEILLIHQNKLQNLLLAAREKKLTNFIGTDIELTELDSNILINLSVKQNLVRIKKSNSLALYYSFDHN